MNSDAFYEWLLLQGYASSTARQRPKDAGHYLLWLQQAGHTAQGATYGIVMDYVAYLRAAGISGVTIAKKLRSIGQYYHWQGWDNPCRSIRIMPSPSTCAPLLDAVMLDRFYQTYSAEKTGTHAGYYYHSDKLILGLIIYQGLDRPDIYGLLCRHIDLEKGTIYIQGSSRSNSRELSLTASQVLPLHHYVHHIRPELLKKPKSVNYTPIQESEKLFVPQCESPDRLAKQWKKLKGKCITHGKSLGYRVYHLRQLRHSRLSIWAGAHDIRKAQYLAGFKTVRGIERYQEMEIENLQQQLKQYHPLQ